MKNIIWKCTGFVALFLTGYFISENAIAQEVKHPDMELIEDEKGEQVVVLMGTERAPDPKLYVIKEEQTATATVYSVVYKPTGETITFFTKSTVKGKVEGPGVSLYNSRVTPEIEKVVGQKSYDKEIKRRYLDAVFIEKAEFLKTETVNLKEIERILKKRRN